MLITLSGRGPFILILATALSARAQAPETLSLRQALDLSQIDNPVLMASDAQIASRIGLRDQAALKPNPRIVVQQENAQFWGGTGLNYWRETDTYLYGAMVVERGGKRERRIEAAGAAVATANEERNIAGARLRGRVASAYWSAAGAASVLALYREDLGTLGRIVEYNRQRVAEGKAAGVDLLKIEVERERMAAAALRAQQDADLTRIALFRAMVRPDSPRVVLTESLEAIPDVRIASVVEALRMRPEVRAAQASVDEAAEKVCLQQANAKTDPEYQFGFKRALGFNTLYAAVSLPLPVRNRNQGNISAAEADMRTAQHSLEAIRNDASAEFEAASAAYRAKREAFEKTLTPLRAKARETARIMLAAYREGGVDILQFLDAERTRIETEVLWLQSLADIQQSIVALKLAEGESL
ncbi:MAG: TolC family protein [Acidobacteriota bacterium]|nr:TolC family protein [Acidobacteriota bacterium]